MRCVATSMCAAAIVFAQTRTATINGTVTDPNGLGVNIAPVQAKNVATNAAFQATTASDGAFTITGLPPGNYDITIPPIGFMFAKFERKNVAVDATQPLRLDLHLAWSGNLGTPGDDISGLVRGRGRPKGKTPRTREGKPDFSGVWVGNAPEQEDAELLPWAEAFTKERRAKGGAGNPGEACLPGDIFLVSPFIYKIIQTPAVIAILWEGNVPGVAQIFLDGRSHPKDPFPTWMGHSVGKWEGDTLVVDTVGFNDLSWVRAYPHTEKLHVIQRYRRPDLGHIEKEVTVEDTGAFTKPWKIRTTWDLAPNEEVEEYVCNENEKDVPHIPGR